MYWEAKIECAPHEEIEQIQLERLQSTLNRAYKSVSHYRQCFDADDIVIEDIARIEDLARLPFTTRKDLENNYPYGLFAVPLREVVRIHTTTETVDSPAVIGYTQNDLTNWGHLVARFLTAGEVTKEDVIQVSFLYGLYTGAFGLHHGAEKIKASVIPASAGNTVNQIRIMQDYRTTVLVSTPSYALILARQMAELGVDPKTLLLKKGLFGGEIWSEDTRKEIETLLFIDAYDNYGVSELMGPGIATECPEKKGLHIFEDHFLPEVIDPETLAPVPPGQIGELVITTLTREAFPLIRFRTGDLTRLDRSPCACGRTLVRMQRIENRADDIILMKGIAIVPRQIEKILSEVEGTTPVYQIVVRREGYRDMLEVRMAMTEQMFSDEMRRQGTHIDRLKKALRHRLGIHVEVRLMEPSSLEKGLQTEPKVWDQRKL